MFEYFWQFCHRFFRETIGLKMKTTIFIYGMRLMLIFLNFLPMYAVNFELLEYKKNKMDVLIYKSISNFLHIMALISYFLASFK